MRSVARRVLMLAVLLYGASPALAAETATLEVDATDFIHGIHHVRLVIPAKPGPLALAYPQWINDAIAGPITQVVRLGVTAAGETLPWRRDPHDAYLIRVEVPARATAVEVRFDFLSPSKAFGASYERSPGVTPHLTELLFNPLVFYPADADINEFLVSARVRIPPGWKFDSPLEPRRDAEGALVFPTVPLATLVDSPLLVGEYFRTIPVTSGEGATRLSVAADAAEDLDVGEATVTALASLAREANALFGARHYRKYVWLIGLAGSLNHDGIEHHEATDIRGAESYFADPAQVMVWGRLMAHEYVHSWNGKYRVPAGLRVRSYQQRVDDSLLWLYEGMTRYWGDLVLRGRSGMRSPAQLREYVAWIAASMELDRPGRDWRPLADTATTLPEYIEAPDEWTPIRRSVDYYDEMLLVWLEADTIIRQHTGGSRSLDDFARAFFGGESGGPSERPYVRADIISALSAVASYDWDSFLRIRVDDVARHAPLAGLGNGGWKLIFNDTPNEYLDAREKVFGVSDLSYSLGFWITGDGDVADVVHDSPVFQAGIAPAMKVLAIDGHRWSLDAAHRAIQRAETTREPLELIVQQGDLVRVLRIEYHGGLKYPHLERDGSHPDLLGSILEPRVRGK